MTTEFIKHDGGRAAAGYRGSTGDCVCRALSIITERPYEQVYAEMQAWVKARPPRKGRRSSPRTGMVKADTRALMTLFGGVWHPTMRIGQGCNVHLRPSELPSGRLIVKLTRHVAAVIDGVIYDSHDPSRGGTRCVYGYWRFAQPGSVTAKQK